MKIETKDYLITSDSMNIIVQFKHFREDSHFLEDKSKLGEVVLGRKLYFKTLEGAYQEITRHRLTTSADIESLVDIKVLMESLAEEVRQLAKVQN